ncbi:MAG TPA: APC family permease [Streptosporangiaceae bacterium]|jgi:APA family basic amino acid/polyamine antiporter|nr:APC family permease [Streptosporangiaceae bacterium]
MATEALGDERPALFLRNATGLVRGWNVRDSLIYAVLSTNFVTLGLFTFTYAGPSFPTGQLLTSVVISAILVSFLVVAYTGLITTIPRAGGDYVWQTRILGSGVGFVFAVTGWWFILWLWAPIYGNILAIQFFEPLWATLGSPSGAAWFGTNNGIFVVSLVTIVLAGVLVSIGMAGYARIQKWCIYGGLIGFAVIVVLLLINSHADFIASFNQESSKIFGVNHAYAATNAAAIKAGYHAPAMGFGPLGATLLLVPNMMFFILWPNWGASLYGEIRGASDFKRVFRGMFFGLWITTALVVIFFLLMAKTFGWAFYQNANAAFFNGTFPLPVWPYPFMFVGWLVHNTAFQVILILVMSLWFFGWVGTLFLSSTRVIFAAAFDRVLPDRAAEVSEKRKVPLYSLILMLLPAVGLSAIYAYSTNFRTYTLDATLVIAVTYLVSAIAVVLLPFVKKDLWRASPASKVKLLGVPIVPVSGVITILLLGFCLIAWLVNDNYFVNNPSSLIFMGAMYVLAIVLYVVARLVRRRQGIDLGLINKEIPVE